jgi:glycosyltransferase involved in cell wall biosynthesis
MNTEVYPQVSIIVPVFNRQNLVGQLIKTVLNQTFSDWELLLIDDSSTDATVDTIKKLSNGDSRIKIANNMHLKGPSGARNTGLDLANGKYITYQDSDDEWIAGHLETMVYYLEKYPDKIDVMSANPLRKYLETNEVFNYDQINIDEISHTKVEEAYLIDTDVLFDTQLKGRAITTQCMIGKADIMKSVRWNEKLNAAVDIMHNLALCALRIKVGHIQEYHAIYWAHNDNLTNCGGHHSAKRMEKVHSAFVLYWQLVLKEFTLNEGQTKFVKNELAKTFAWHLAYHTYEPQKKYLEAISCYREAIKLQSFDFKIWLALMKAYLKYWVRN